MPTELIESFRQTTLEFEYVDADQNAEPPIRRTTNNDLDRKIKEMLAEKFPTENVNALINASDDDGTRYIGQYYMKTFAASIRRALNPRVVNEGRESILCKLRVFTNSTNLIISVQRLLTPNAWIKFNNKEEFPLMRGYNRDYGERFIYKFGHDDEFCYEMMFNNHRGYRLRCAGCHEAISAGSTGTNYGIEIKDYCLQEDPETGIVHCCEPKLTVDIVAKSLYRFILI